MKRSTKKPTLSLYECFKPGDRVKRTYQGGKGKNQINEGIIMTMDHDQLEIFWDKINGVYCPSLFDDEFTICFLEEVMYGTKKYSPMKQK